MWWEVATLIKFFKVEDEDGNVFWTTINPEGNEKLIQTEYMNKIDVQILIQELQEAIRNE